MVTDPFTTGLVSFLELSCLSRNGIYPERHRRVLHSYNLRLPLVVPFPASLLSGLPRWTALEDWRVGDG